MSKGSRLGEFEETLLLCACGLGDEASSVRIQERLWDDAGRSAALGAIYAAFDRMERKGLARSRLAAPTAQRGGRRKRIYTVTPKGKRALEAARTTRRVLWSRIEGKALGVPS